MTNEKHFLETISQWGFDYGFLQIYREQLSLPTFPRVHSNSKEVSYLTWQNKYPNLKTNCHSKLKIFSWTKLLENLILIQKLISVAAALTLWKMLKANLKRFQFMVLRRNMSDSYVSNTDGKKSFSIIIYFYIYMFCWIVIAYLNQFFKFWTNWK